MTKIRQGRDSTEDVMMAADVLEYEIQETFSQIDNDIAVKVDGAISQRLATMQVEFAQARTSNYRSTYTALRLVELATTIRALPDKPYEETAELRAKAAENYGKILADFEAEVTKRTLSKRSEAYVKIQIPRLLQEARDNPLASGYGILLTDAETAELNRLLHAILPLAEAGSDSSPDFSQADMTKRQMEDFRKLADAYHKVWRHIIKCEQDRRNAKPPRDLPPSLLSKTHRILSEKTQQAIKVESAARMEHYRQEAERMKRENNPAEIERRRKELEKQRQ
ncbi:hypothetical protein LOC68_04370 [Blastopirellula sp. JC732]|uniref:Uncharacterized protein n=1 Tax=Blastopirellula sediminis TaxID=2894196 RepID=A0A9X1MJS4_9BACT|nr:hypothetical protein [Blastopirellula sediminis]MCC9609607.1 hypothetical protein [Blastopirellula sediminis]MCC9627617.1 hypothetical protein [Blastopirellula sediminis]